MQITPLGSTIPDVSHHRIPLNATELHYVTAGAEGPAVLLIHGFPETWWTFHKVIPLLAKTHRAFAVDLRGFGDSSNADGEYGSRVSADDLHALIEFLDLGPMHVVAQDISGGIAFRLATHHRDDVSSLTAIEMGLAGFGLEKLADVTHGGSWHIGVLAAGGIPDMLLQGRESEFIGWLFKSMTVVQDAVTDADITEFVRSYKRPNGWRGAEGLYRAMLAEGAEFADFARKQCLEIPVMAVGAGGGDFTASTMAAAFSTKVESVQLSGVGHYAAMEAPYGVAMAVLEFARSVDRSKRS
jgi:pimeloyl-ACP methyl ester carboxylesterase